MAPLSIITGCAGPSLSGEERAFLRDARPWGFILFARNIVDAEQVRALVADLRDTVGAHAPVLIDQEGGRVQRLKPPLAPIYPPAGRIAELHARDREAGELAAWLHARLIAEDLFSLGIDVDCVPVLDLRIDCAHDIVGDRSYGSDPETVSRLAGLASEGLKAGGVAAIAKHIPGHGRALADSHVSLPMVDAGVEELGRTDFVPFRKLATLPMAMTAHILYTAIDAERPATLSPVVVGDIIRGDIGFDGLLMTDDLSMNALAGSMTERTAAAFAAGCDIALHCNGDLGEMEAVATASPELSGRSLERATAARAWAARQEADIAALRAEFDALMGTGTA